MYWQAWANRWRLKMHSIRSFVRPFPNNRVSTLEKPQWQKVHTELHTRVLRRRLFVLRMAHGWGGVWNWFNFHRCLIGCLATVGLCICLLCFRSYSLCWKCTALRARTGCEQVRPSEMVKVLDSVGKFSAACLVRTLIMLGFNVEKAIVWKKKIRQWMDGL